MKQTSNYGFFADLDDTEKDADMIGTVIATIVYTEAAVEDVTPGAEETRTKEEIEIAKINAKTALERLNRLREITEKKSAEIMANRTVKAKRDAGGWDFGSV